MVQKIAIFQHVANEPSGFFETVFLEKGIPYEYIHLYDTNEISLPREVSHLIFMGGPMSVNDEAEYPWLSQEKELIRRSIKQRQKVLGICLGAQLIASSHGAKVYRFIQETGWHPVSRVHETVPAPFRSFPDRFHVFQLHGETFEIPYGGQRLVYGDNVRNQAFQYRNALGLQFHLEMTEEIAREWSKELNRHQQSRVARDTPRYLTESNRLCRIIAEEFVAPYRK
jgi:GMP synthase-like glutamine amidotransferase